MLLASGSPLNTWLREDEILLQHIAIARQLKEIDTVVLYAHAPCGAATLHQLSFIHVLETLRRAKIRLKTVDDKIKVACFCHIDYGHDKKRTYFFSTEAFKRAKPALAPRRLI